MDYKTTTNKLGSSRLLKLTLIGIGTLLFVKLLSYLMIGWIIYLTSTNIELEKVRIYLNIIDILNVPVAGAIATIITAIIARYGVRESLTHLTKPVEKV